MELNEYDMKRVANKRAMDTNAHIESEIQKDKQQRRMARPKSATPKAPSPAARAKTVLQRPVSQLAKQGYQGVKKAANSKLAKGVGRVAWPVMAVQTGAAVIDAVSDEANSRLDAKQTAMLEDSPQQTAYLEALKNARLAGKPMPDKAQFMEEYQSSQQAAPVDENAAPAAIERPRS
jgi:hypothetical protein